MLRLVQSARSSVPHGPIRSIRLLSSSSSSASGSSPSVSPLRVRVRGLLLGAGIGFGLSCAYYAIRGEPESHVHEKAAILEMRRALLEARADADAAQLAERALRREIQAAQKQQAKQEEEMLKTIESEENQKMFAYIEKHRLNTELEKLIGEAVEKQVEDPFGFLGRAFLSRSPSKSSPTVESEIVPAEKIPEGSASYIAPNPAATQQEEGGKQKKSTTASTETPITRSPAKKFESSKHALKSIPSSAEPSSKQTGSTPSSPSSSSSSSSPSSAASPTQEEEDAEYAKFKQELEQGFSAEPNPDSGRPHIRNIVASEIPALIDSRSSDVLLQIYAPWCGACKMMAPVVDAVAQIMHDAEEKQKQQNKGESTNHLQVFVMDGEANVAPGFLSEEENRALPLIKFFPACGTKQAPEEVRRQEACQPRVFQGRPNVEAIVEFLYQAMKAEQAATGKKSDAEPFSLGEVHDIAKQLEPKTHAAVEKALMKRFEQDSADMPALKLHEIAPCGEELNRLMKRFMLSGYTSYVSPEEDEREGQKLFHEYRSCTDREEKKLEEFWTQVKKQTDEALENLENKKKSRAAEQQQAEPEETESASSNETKSA